MMFEYRREFDLSPFNLECRGISVSKLSLSLSLFKVGLLSGADLDKLSPGCLS